MPERPPNSNIYAKNGGYEKLRSHQMAELLEDITKPFVARYVDRWSRTTDQMIQASRRGARNIAEGSMFSATSKKFEMNITNTARSSITELKKDYAAFLRHNKLWPMNDKIRQELIDSRFKQVDDVARWGAHVHKRDPSRSFAEISANIGHVYCMVAVELLDRQMQSQARDSKRTAVSMTGCTAFGANRRRKAKALGLINPPGQCTAASGEGLKRKAHSEERARTCSAKLDPACPPGVASWVRRGRPKNLSTDLSHHHHQNGHGQHHQASQ